MTRARLALLLALASLLAPGAPAAASQVLAVFPSDRLTVVDPAQLTGRRVALPLPDCAAEWSTCNETRLLNQLDGFSVNPRVSIRFAGPITLDSVTRDSVFILPLWSEPLPSPVALAQLVWDADGATLHARPERVLLQGRRYAVIVTTRVVDADNRVLRPQPDLLGARGLGGDVAALEAQLARALEGAGVKRREVAAAVIFTTQSVTADLERMREEIALRPAPEVRFTLVPGGSRSVFARAEMDALQFRRQVAVKGDDRLELAPVRPLSIVPPDAVKTIAVGAFRAISFLGPDRHLAPAPTRTGVLRITGEEEVHVTVLLPASAAPERGYPVAIFGHGITGDRHASLLAAAAVLARHGFATVGINVVGHGGGPEGTLVVSRTGAEPVILPAGGRGVDVDGDGKIGLSEGLSTFNRGPVALLSSRDGLKQTVADLMQLVRALRRGVDVDGDGRPDLDGERVYYFGQSLGGIYGTLLMAVEPAVKVGVLNVAGGPLVEIGRQSPIFRAGVATALSSRRPSLMNGENEFYEFIPLFGEGPVRPTVRGALEIQAFLDRAEWLTQSAGPVAFAPYLRQAPLAGGSPKAVLYQMAVGDRTVPNATTESLLRAGGLQLQQSVYRHDRVVATLPERFNNPHGYLLWTAFPEVVDIGRAAQEQVARFFLSAGRQIDRVDDRFEVQVARPSR